MATPELKRTDYWNRVTGTVRNGNPTRTENVTDIENFTIPYVNELTAGLHLWGVATGLTVSGIASQSGIFLTPGSAADSAGHLIALTAGSIAIISPDIDPGQTTDIPTIPVTGNGITLPTTGISGNHYVTIRHHEVTTEGLLGNAPTLTHAPWVRLLSTTDFEDSGVDLVLAQVSLNNGNVTGLTPKLRRHTGIQVDRIQLHRPHSGLTPTFTVTHRLAAELATQASGNLTLTQTGSQPTLTLDAKGNLGLGAGTPQRVLHAEGTEIHSGGSGGGFSFANRSTGSFQEMPDAGQRWVWYALEGSARLWSRTDRLTVNLAPNEVGLDVNRRMRIRAETTEATAGTWLFQNGKDRSFVGLADDTHVGFWGSEAGGWGLRMDTTTLTCTISPKLGPFDFLGFQGVALTVMGRGEFHAGGTFHRGIHVIAPIGVVGGFVGPAALFEGDVRIQGTLTKSALQFRIDHPLDPANKYLQHSAIESDELKNLYDGIVELGADGTAEVAVAEWFEALNEQVRYQLTPLGSRAPDLHVARELRDGRFAIAGGAPGLRISWQLTGVRHDAYAKAHPMAVETAKPEDEAGLFIHPDVHGEAADRSVASAYKARSESWPTQG
ncbi:hypothetical protein [Nocardia sp. NPDC051832]|uniref:hypothetical protein n=1 Tax=Nocardia sp. NPDC051832 TaxID=3155673 RepID=UPI003439E0EB